MKLLGPFVGVNQHTRVTQFPLALLIESLRVF